MPLDPKTLIAVLATHLICAGGVLLLMSRRMPARSGLMEWASGAIAFGLAYLWRLWDNLEAPTDATYAVDVAMVLAALLFRTGLRRFLGQHTTPLIVLAIFVGFIIAHLFVLLVLPTPARFVFLNLVLGLLYGWLASDAFIGTRLPATSAALRPPLITLSALFAGLGTLSTLRGLLIDRLGMDSMYRGTFAVVYFSFASLVAVTIGLLLLWMVFLRLNTQLAELATRDELTRVLNRNGLNDALARHFAQRPPRPLQFLVVDIDHFKAINDQHGHACGDTVLRAVAKELREHCRGEDFVARTGGEEFLIACVAGNPAGGMELAERMRAAVAELPLTNHRGARLQCTVSVGVSELCTEFDAWHSTVEQADKALYEAKRRGRNRSVAFATLQATPA